MTSKLVIDEMRIMDAAESNSPFATPAPPAVSNPAAKDYPPGMLDRGRAFVAAKLANEPTDMVFMRYVEACLPTFFARMQALAEKRRALRPRVFVGPGTPPPGWVHAETADSAIQLLYMGKVVEVSLPSLSTQYSSGSPTTQIVRFLAEERSADPEFEIPIIYVRSRSNPARHRVERWIASQVVGPIVFGESEAAP